MKKREMRTIFFVLIFYLILASCKTKSEGDILQEEFKLKAVCSKYQNTLKLSDLTFSKKKVFRGVFYSRRINTCVSIYDLYENDSNILPVGRSYVDELTGEMLEIFNASAKKGDDFIPENYISFIAEYDTYERNLKLLRNPDIFWDELYYVLKRSQKTQFLIEQVILALPVPSR